MIVSPEQVRANRWVAIGKETIESRDKRIQPNGIDLTVESIHRMEGQATITKDNKSLPVYVELRATNTIDGRKMCKLEANQPYLLQVAETISVPKDKVGLVWMRSTFNRCGCPIFACVFDSGYEGKPTFTIYPHIPLYLEKGARVAQILFFDAKAAKTYKGSYQREGLE